MEGTADYKGMDSFIFFLVDRIYRINRILCIAGFLMKPATTNSLREISI